MRLFFTLSAQAAKIIKMANPRCFFDISADGTQLGRIVMEIYADAVPKTAGI